MVQSLPDPERDPVATLLEALPGVRAIRAVALATVAIACSLGNAPPARHVPEPSSGAPAEPHTEPDQPSAKAPSPRDRADRSEMTLQNEAAAEPQALPKVRHPFHEPLPNPATQARAPAHRNSSLSPQQCRAELRRRNLSTVNVAGAARGIATPLRLAGPLQGVHFIAPGKRSVYGMLDCRLALALDDFASLLQEHEIREVHIDNFYRPKAHLPGRKSKRSQHAYGLAADIRGFGLRDGRILRVKEDWFPSLGVSPCGPESPEIDPIEPNEPAILLRNIVCATARAGLFHHLLTPNYDAAHEDHLHFDIRRDARSIVVR